MKIAEGLAASVSASSAEIAVAHQFVVPHVSAGATH
jgi:hypothetical protein